MKLLDLFCGAGGAAMGYYQAGFTEIVGVDNRPMPRYPFEFVQVDALEYLENNDCSQFDLIHASPPCQTYSTTKSLTTKEYPDLVGITRKLLLNTKCPYVIENVVGAPLINPLMLCGTMFNLRVIRHRLFECNPVIWWPPFSCCHNGKSSAAGRGKTKHNPTGYNRGTLENFQFITVVGNDYVKADGEIAMGIDWMTKKELSQAIPPAYTKWLGKQIIKQIGS